MSWSAVFCWKNAMLDMLHERAASMAGVIATRDRWVRWLVEDALPLWENYGLDRQAGGYFEEIATSAAHLAPTASGKVRRGRVVARQIYAFDAGRKMGWTPKMTDPVEHGCRYLFSRMHLGDGLFNTAIDGQSYASQSSFGLYEHAFYLFALARLSESYDGRYPILATARRCLERLRAEWGRAGGGFEESRPPSLPLKSNPHMHLLEAALSWLDITQGADRQPWKDLAREVVDLCLTRFMDSESGAIREFFDDRWQPITGNRGRIVEPGHQFEWAWLLRRWASCADVSGDGRTVCIAAAERLLLIGERWGVEQARGIAVNELWDDMELKDADAKIWPQTERIKAWCVALQYAPTAERAEAACNGIIAATAGLGKYLLGSPAGLWREVWSADGSFMSGPSKASSFYHIVCAIDVLRQTVSAWPRALPCAS